MLAVEIEAMDAATTVVKARMKLGLRTHFRYVKWFMAEYVKGKEAQ